MCRRALAALVVRVTGPGAARNATGSRAQLPGAGYDLVGTNKGGRGSVDAGAGGRRSGDLPR